MPRKKAEPKTEPKAKTLKTVKKTVARTTASAALNTATKSVAKASPKTAVKDAVKTTAKAPGKISPRATKGTTTKLPKSAEVAAEKVAAKASPRPEAAVVNEAVEGEALTGAVLVQKVRDLGNLSKEEKAKACGYYAMTKNGLERVNMMKFLNALIDAEGIDLDGKSGDSNGRGGRSASYRITVQSNGNLLIGAAYTKQMDLKPGDEFKITLGRKHIRLTQVDGDGAMGDADE